MINDVVVKRITSYYDDRGFFAEVVKFGEDTFHEVKQTSYAETYPGIIKAFHWHKKQWDIWFPVKGHARVVLYDLRKNSRTRGQTDVFFSGEDNKMVIAIPPGVAHGYQVIGPASFGIFYHTTKPYNPKSPDEQRIPFDDPHIGFDWTIKNR